MRLVLRAKLRRAAAFQANPLTGWVRRARRQPSEATAIHRHAYRNSPPPAARMLEPKALKSFTFGVPRKAKKGRRRGKEAARQAWTMDAKLGATLRATKCSAETYKKAIAHKKGRSYHEAIALILKNRTLHGEDCGPLLEQCFSKLSDHYAALCCAPTSSASDLRKSYKRLCLRYHPDKSNGTTTTLFQVLVRAWEVLSDAEKRQKYDITRKPTSGLGPKPPPKRTKRKAPCPPSVTKKTAKRPAAKTMRRPTMLRRPTGLRVTARAPHSLTVVWAQVGGAAGYEVMFRRAGRPWPEKGSRVTCAAARKKNLAPAQAYEARVRAVDKAGQPASTFSCSCAAATMLAADPNAAV